MNLFEQWQAAYQLRPYLRHLSDDQLRQRAIDIFSNFTRLTEDGKIGLESADEGPPFWAAKWTHVLEELQTRFGPHPAPFVDGFMKRAPIPDPSSELSRRAAYAVRSTRLPDRPFLVKYGKSNRLEAALTHGRIRIAPASLYSDPSLNHAIHDDELTIVVTPDPEKVRIAPVSQSGELDRESEFTPDSFEESLTAKTNYYVFCLAGDLLHRLFVDFDSDACLLIRDGDEFANRVSSAMTAHAFGWHYHHQPVNYFDPIRPSRLEGANPYFFKHFRFTYQREYRLAWIPKTPAERLEPVHLEIGSLSDICELVALAGPDG